MEESQMATGQLAKVCHIAVPGPGWSATALEGSHFQKKILRHLFIFHLFIFHLFIFHLFIFNHKYKFILMQLKNKKTMWSQWSAWLTQPWIKELILRKWTRLSGVALDGNKKYRLGLRKS